VAEVGALLDLAKSAAVRAGTQLLESVDAVDRSYVHSAKLPREVKAAADLALERDILGALADSQLAVLSEESGYIPSPQPSNRWFIVDPLDGTFNFVKGLGPCAVSIALWEDQTPIFGVIYDLVGGQLAWGGAGMGAFIDGRPISISDTSTLAMASICTGFPVRFDIESDQSMRHFWHLVSPFAKVRMIGSAAVALLHVARGSADVYLEKSIMLWDVAAGIAIVQGAGGAAAYRRNEGEWSYDVIASNVTLMPQVPGAERSGK
jgi:myo-inositol-1(or 4)-monophosphatase